MGFLIYVLWFLLAAVVFMLIAIILLQEGKGGGLGEAFGGAGAETFGVKASGVNRLTAGLGAVFMVLALLINFMYRAEAGESLINESVDEESPFELVEDGAIGGSGSGDAPPE